MGFSANVKTEVLVLCARYCCVCHKPKGLNIEVHHIIPEAEGGSNTIDNAIALCFDCHAAAGHYNDRHPKGSKFSPTELRKHKENWFRLVETNGITVPKETFAELVLKDPSPAVFRPVFIEERTSFENRNFWKDTFSLIGKDFMEHFEQTRKENAGLFRDPHYDAIQTYDDYIDFMNGAHIQMKEPEPYEGCQPFIFELSRFMREGKVYYKSNVVLNLRFVNYGPEVLEDYKLYLHFDNVVSVDSVTKRNSIFDQHKYSYNVFHVEGNTLEYLPDRPVLVQNDGVLLDAICFRASHKAKLVNIRWELFARNFQLSGILSLNMKPKIIKRPTTRYVDNKEGMKDVVVIRPELEFDFK
ncbi:MAG: HNH endonuclease [Chitinophagaceae bacterium]|nr:HNH endonuclease [Chitinophagaceae bacterium]MCA6455475.1 HNH endonuclease [Chitinophagaceae bacterium]MCA6460562.1 HNH endonuclease [Chitinophagaceae bacterium]MCA6464092.1 HNH endonuclease [Chitinophagaceae bacterium]